MDAKYRTDYPGEFVVVRTKWVAGKKEQQREWVENPIVNQHLSGRAVCIGSTINRNQLDHTYLENHRGGLLGSLNLQTYGTAAIAQEMKLHFAVDTDYKNLEPLVENKYTEQNIVYTTARNCIQHPGEFYLIPQAPHICTEALPLYLAAFDGHKEIYMLGYNIETPATHSDWVEHVTSIIQAYSGTRFIMIGNKMNMFDDWLAQPNTHVYSFAEFISYCDV
jgi:hypothetical protein